MNDSVRYAIALLAHSRGALGPWPPQPNFAPRMYISVPVETLVELTELAKCAPPPLRAPQSFDDWYSMLNGGKTFRQKHGPENGGRVADTFDEMLTAVAAYITYCGSFR